MNSFSVWNCSILKCMPGSCPYTTIVPGSY